MPTISLTHFVDFVSKAGTRKLTVVKNIKQQLQDEYDPAVDFYKPLRDAIVQMHKSSQPKSALDSLLADLTDKKKITAYPPIVKGYQKFLGSKQVSWFEPPKDEWNHGGLSVKVNPEIGLLISDTPYVIKLYFKADQLTKLRIDIATHLMELTLSNKGKPLVFGVLDVRNGKLFPAGVALPGITALLQGEAVSFASIYAAI